MNAPQIVRTDHMPPDMGHVPVAVVGAGACGHVAGLRLRSIGIDCVLLERDTVPSGSTALSSGFILVAGTRDQRALGIEDSSATVAEDVQAKAHGDAEAHLAVAYTQAVAEAVDALGQHGIASEVLEGFHYSGHRARRMHALAEHTGAALLAALGRAAADAGVDVLTDALVRTLYATHDGRILGVGFTRPDGRQEQLACDVLLLACNGFGGNRAMVLDLLPDMQDAVFAGHVGKDGSAIDWGRALGARTADLGSYQGHGSWATPHNALMSWAVMMAGGVQFHRHGERFHDGTAGYPEAAVDVLQQPSSIAWTGFDAQLVELERTFPNFVDPEGAGALKSADDSRLLWRV